MAAFPDSIVRIEEWRRIREFAKFVPTRPAGLAIAGEAGAGKSTLWRSAIDAAAQAGHRVLRSEPSATEAELSFAGLSDLLGDLMSSVGHDIPAPQREALEVALLLRPTGEEPPTAHALSLAVLAVLRVCLEDGPTLIAIDDVQWLDAASLEAMTFALRRLTTGPLSVLLAARSDAPADPLTVGAPPPSRDWQDLLNAVPAQRIDLAPLTTEQVRNVLPTSLSKTQIRLITERARGNPFWAKEIVASQDSPESPLAPTARGLTQRLAHLLSPEAAQALAVVAAAGHIRMSDALTVLDALPDPVAALDAAALAGAVIESRGRLTAAHPLIGAAAIEALPPGRRQHIYLRLAETSTSRERYAYFLALAAGVGPDRTVAEALDVAATAAQCRAANVAAGQFAAQAVSFTPEYDQRMLVTRQIRAGELLFLGGDIERSLAQLAGLDLDTLDTPDLERALPLLLDMTDIVRGTPEATAIITRVVQATGSDPRRRALVLALASDVVYGVQIGRGGAAVDAIRSAEAAGADADPALHRALLNLVVAKVIAGEGLDSDLLDRAARLETRLSTTRLYDTAELTRGLWSRFVEDLETSRAALRRSIIRAADAYDELSQCMFLAYLAGTEALAGDYRAAEDAISEADGIAAWHHWPPSPWQLEPKCELLIAAGDFATALDIVEQLSDDGSSMAVGFVRALVRGKISAWQDDPAAAAQYFERAKWWADQYEWIDPGIRHRLDVVLAEAYVRLGQVEDALRISRTLREIGTRQSRHAVIGDAARIDALAAARRGDLDAAAASAQTAVTAHEASPLRPELVRSLLVLGQIQRRRKARRQASEALGHAHDLATTMGHQPLVAEIERELPRVAGLRSRSSLTATEQRVAELIANGATNRDAATALFVSVRTIESHVATIYRKLGVHSRSELARRFARTALPHDVGP